MQRANYEAIYLTKEAVCLEMLGSARTLGSRVLGQHNSGFLHPDSSLIYSSECQALLLSQLCTLSG